MQTLLLSAQNSGDGIETVATRSTAPDPLIDGPAEALWIGFGAFVVIFITVLYLIIRARVIGPARRKAMKAQFFEPAGEDADFAFDASGEADDAPVETEDAALAFDAPEDEDDSDGSNSQEEREGAFASLFQRRDAAEPTFEDAIDAAFDDIPDAPETPAPAPRAPEPRPRQSGAALDERFAALADSLNARIDSAVAGVSRRAGASDPGLSPKTAAEFVEALSREVASLRRSTQDAVEGLTRRLDALIGAPPERATTLAGEVAKLNVLLAETQAAPPAAGQVQLRDLVRSALPAHQYALAEKLATGRSADCLIYSPSFPAPVAVDARFPAEAFDRYWRERANPNLAERARDEYRRAVLRHIVEVAETMIAPGETADFAIMFAPSETIFNNLHAEFSDLVQDSYRAKVWIFSPTSLMASLHMMSAFAGAGAATPPPKDAAPAPVGEAENEAKGGPASRAEKAFDRLQREETSAEARQKAGKDAARSFPLRSTD